jgi:hypothetical protein
VIRTNQHHPKCAGFRSILVTMMFDSNRRRASAFLLAFVYLNELGRYGIIVDAFLPSMKQQRWRPPCRPDFATIHHHCQPNTVATTLVSPSQTSSSLHMNRNRGLERRIDRATPTGNIKKSDHYLERHRCSLQEQWSSHGGGGCSEDPSCPAVPTPRPVSQLILFYMFICLLQRET